LGLCRPIEIRDILKLSGLNRSLLRLDVPESILHPYSPVSKALLAAAWPLARTRVVVHEAGGSLTSYLLHQVNRPTARVLLMASRFGPEEAVHRDYTWQCLLEEAMRRTGQAGVSQIAAKVPEDAEALALFARAGFRTAGKEFLFGAPTAALGPWADPLPGRPAGRWDRSVFSKLFSELCRTPGVEPLWPIAFPKRWRGGQTQLFAWDTASGPLVFIAVFGQSRRMLRILYDPSAREILPGSLAWMMSWLANQRPRTIYVAVRETQQELSSILESMGFKHLLTHALQVKDVVRRVRVGTSVQRVPFEALSP
jgi:hypothetical protein